MTNDQIQALYKLYPNVVRTVDDTAYDSQDNQVEIDLVAVEAKTLGLQTEKESAKQSALNKLMALGLTEEEALALGK
jgi:hypothetical protein